MLRVSKLEECRIELSMNAFRRIPRVLSGQVGLLFSVPQAKAVHSSEMYGSCSRHTGTKGPREDNPAD